MPEIVLPELASAPREAAHSGIREIAGLALATPGCIRLEVGEPDFTTPDHIRAAAKAAIDEGFTRYTPTRGIQQLREQLAAKLKLVNGLDIDPDQNVAVTPGGVGAVAATMASILEIGDEVLLPDPCWPNFRIMLSWTHTEGVFYPCPLALAYLPDLERLEALITPRTKVLVVNSPNNPTGAVYPPEVLQEMAAIARRHNLWLISDECYDQILFEGAPLSMASLQPDGRVISIFTFSKSYAMTGWRMGYAVGEPELMDSITKILESNSSCTSSITQRAALAALTGPQDCVAEMVAAYRNRRDLCVDLLREAELLTTEPAGAFYIMADVSPSGMGSREFAFRLLRERGVAVAPGTAFGEETRDAVRISLASSEADLREGISRLSDFVRTVA